MKPADKLSSSAGAALGRFIFRRWNGFICAPRMSMQKIFPEIEVCIAWKT